LDISYPPRSGSSFGVADSLYRRRSLQLHPQRHIKRPSIRRNNPRPRIAIRPAGKYIWFPRLFTDAESKSVRDRFERPCSVSVSSMPLLFVMFLQINLTRLQRGHSDCNTNKFFSAVEIILFILHLFPPIYQSFCHFFIHSLSHFCIIFVTFIYYFCDIKGNKQ
jgi:hypothetical protein